MIEKLKNDMSELERKQGIEQARQARVSIKQRLVEFKFSKDSHLCWFVVIYYILIVME